MKDFLIGVVGPCAAGKSTLIQGLLEFGLSARHIAQEHSMVPDMWKRLTNPDVLIFLDVSYPPTIKRKNMGWTETEYNEQRLRLQHAIQNADLYIHTDLLTIEEVRNEALSFIRNLDHSPLVDNHL